MEHVVLEGGVGTRLLRGVWEKDRWLQRGCLFPPPLPQPFSPPVQFPSSLSSPSVVRKAGAGMARALLELRKQAWLEGSH